MAVTNQKRTTKKNTSRTNTGSSTKRNTVRTTAKKRTTGKGNTAKSRTSSQADRSSSRKNKKEEQMDMAMVREAIMLAVSAVVIVFLLCNFGLCGKFGTILSSLMFGLFGITAYVFPILLFLGVLFWVSNIGSGKAKVKLISAVIVYLAVCAVLQQISFPYEKDTGLMTCYTFSAEKHQGGGWIGALLGHIFVPFIGALGMHILMTALILAGAVLITEKSLVGGVRKHGSRMVQVAAEDTRRRTKVRQVHREEKQQVRADRKGKGVASAAIFTLDESSASPEMEMPYQEEEEFLEQTTVSAQEQINDVEQEAPYQEQTGYMEQAEPLYQEQMKYTGQPEPIYQNQTGYMEQPEPLYQEQMDYMGQPEPLYQKQMDYMGQPELSYQDRMDYMGQPESSYQDRMDYMGQPESSYQEQMDYMRQPEPLYQEQMEYTRQAESSYQKQEGYEESTDYGRTMLYQEEDNFPYENDILQNPLETFSRIPEEKHPQDMTIYQDVMADVGIGVDIPPEMVPFPIAGKDYRTSVEEQQEAEWPIKYNDKKKDDRKKNDIDTKENKDRFYVSESGMDRESNAEKDGKDDRKNSFYIKESNSFSGQEGWSVLDSHVLTKQKKAEQKDLSDDMGRFSLIEEGDSQILSDMPSASIDDMEQSVLLSTKTLESTEAKSDIERDGVKRNDIEKHNIEKNDIEREDIISEIVESEELPVVEYEFPSLSLLTKGKQNLSDQQQEVENQMIAQKLEKTLRSFGVGVTVTDVTSGPTVTRYELLPAQGVKVSRIVGLADDIKLSLAAADIRIEAPIPGKSAVGIEVPNKEVATVMLRDLLESENFQQHSSRLAFAVGKDIEGQTIVTDIAKMPHALIAGATGSGKSVCINTLIMSILYKAHPDDVKLIMVDPKVVELSVYNGIPHLLIPVVTDPKKAAGALNWAVAEMTDRYNKFSEWNVRNIQGYNEKVEALKDEVEEKLQKMPQIVIIIDELADLMMVASNEVEEAICRLAQLARAAGIHLIIATQRPSVNVITGLIKANVPSRIAFAVSSGVDSRTILDTVGAEKLLGRGDMLFAPYGASSPTRIQGAFVSDSEVSAVVEFLKGQKEFIAKSTTTSQMVSVIASGTGVDGGSSGRDDYFIEAGRLILQNEKASIGMLQRKFKIGFNRAARIMDQLADAGVVGPEEGTKPRKVLMSLEEFEDTF